MGEADLAVVEQPFGAGRGQRGRDIDHIDVGKGAREFGKRDVGQPEPGAVSLHAAFRKSQRLNGRLGQIVDQDRRGGHFAQLAQKLGGMRDIGRMRVEAVNVLGDEVPGPQGADENHIVLALAGKANVVGERRRHMQIDAAARRFPAQEVGFHLDIAIAEQQRIDAPSGGAEIVEAVGRRRPPNRSRRPPSIRAGSARAFRRGRAHAWRQAPRRSRPVLPPASFRSESGATAIP